MSRPFPTLLVALFLSLTALQASASPVAVRMTSRAVEQILDAVLHDNGAQSAHVVLVKGERRLRPTFEREAKPRVRPREVKPVERLPERIGVSRTARERSLKRRVDEMRFPKKVSVKTVSGKRFSEKLDVTRKLIDQRARDRSIVLARLRSKVSLRHAPAISASMAERNKIRENVREAISAERDIRDPRNPIFERAKLKLDPATIRALDSYRAGNVGQTAKDLAPKISQMSRAQFLEFMRNEVISGRATEAPKIDLAPKGAARPNEMRIWEYRDGTVVRYKPDGDRLRPFSVYSIEVKKDRLIPDAERRDQGIAFKVDKDGRALPKSPNDMPVGVSNTYVNVVMGATHRGFRD